MDPFYCENCSDNPWQCEKTCVLTLVPALYNKFLEVTKISSTSYSSKSMDSLAQLIP